MLSPGALLAALLAVASVAVLAGGRMAEHTRRTGLLKAAGGAGPGRGRAAGREPHPRAGRGGGRAVAGWLAAPLITSPGAALVGIPGAPSLTLATAGEVIAVALAVALAATLVPAVRAARISTVRALADVARPPRRRPRLIAVSGSCRSAAARAAAGRPPTAPRRAQHGELRRHHAGLVAVLSFHVAAAPSSAGPPAG